MSLTDKLLDLEHSDQLFQSAPLNETDGNQEMVMPGTEQVHRSVAALFVEGNSPTQIAEKLRLDEQKVRNLLKQKHTQEVLRELVGSRGPEGIEAMLQATMVENVLTLIEVRDDPMTPKNVKVQAVSKLFELQRGKKPFGGNDDSETQKGERLARSVEELDKQIQELQKKK